MSRLTYEQYVALALNKRIGRAVLAQAAAEALRVNAGQTGSAEFYEALQDDPTAATEDAETALMRAAIARHSNAR